ncbi:hypothetical protein RIF29_38564 [Crotalaria pallida]|uniref:Uncharacterized protein n=1 Tax=Crotalaria pallida TaxID=3830 RepID=A0AAN9HSI0_CROPI
MPIPRGFMHQSTNEILELVLPTNQFNDLTLTESTKPMTLIPSSLKTAPLRTTGRVYRVTVSEGINPTCFIFLPLNTDLCQLKLCTFPRAFTFHTLEQAQPFEQQLDQHDNMKG